jgi:hypothetical protein
MRSHAIVTFMEHYPIFEHSHTQLIRSVTIPDPEDENAGWSYNAHFTEEGTISIEGAGEVLVRYLPAVLALFKHTSDVDVTQGGESTIQLGSTYHQTVDSLIKYTAGFVVPVTGVVAHDVFITTASFLDLERNMTTTVTVTRIAKHYLVLVGGTPMLSFRAHELAGMTALLSSFVESNLTP